MANRVDRLDNPVWIGAPDRPAAECYTLTEAKRNLGLRRWSTLQHRVYVGILEKCTIDGSALGVTRSSVERELAWWHSATVGSKIRRRLREFVSYL